jgi:hypothetical protein
MGQLRTALQAERGLECPQEREWPLVAAGMKKEREAEALLRHAAECDHCGPLLRQYTERNQLVVTIRREMEIVRAFVTRQENDIKSRVRIVNNNAVLPPVSSPGLPLQAK